MVHQRGGQATLKNMHPMPARDHPHTWIASETIPKLDKSSSSPRWTAGRSLPRLTRTVSLCQLTTVLHHKQRSTRAHRLSRHNPSSPRTGFSSSRIMPGSRAASPTCLIANLSVFLSLPTQTVATASDGTLSTYDITLEFYNIQAYKH